MKTWTEPCGWARAATAFSNSIMIENASSATGTIPTIQRALGRAWC